MPYDPAAFQSILDGMLEDVRNRISGVDTTSDTELYAFLATAAGGIWMLSYGLKWVENQIFPATADDDNLDRHAATYGLSRKAAQAASNGTVRITGSVGAVGTVIPAGTRLLTSDGVAYTVDSDTTMVLAFSPSLIALAAFTPATCEEVGTTGNRSYGEPLTVEDPPSGVDAEAIVDMGFSDGAEAETSAQLLRRLLLRIQSGGAGGTKTDYVQWALEVAGVAYAYCLPLRRGAGCVTVVVYGEEDGYPVDPGAGIRSDVADYIETVRPVTAEVDVAEPDDVEVDVEVEITEIDDGYELADIEADIEAAIKDTIHAVEPGGTLFLKQLIRAIARIDGVLDFEIAEPAANVAAAISETALERLIPGTITIT